MRTIIVIFLMAFVAAACASAAPAETPQSPDDLIWQGWRFLDRGLNVEALKAFQEAKAAAPENVDTQRGYQDAMIALGKTEELRDEYKKMTDEKPDSAAACYLYSRLLENADEERQWLDKAKTLDEKFPYAYYGLGLQDKSRGDKESAEKNLRHAIELKPDFVHAYRALGMLYMGAAKPDDAEKLYADAATNLPKETFPHSYLCDIYESKGDYDKALGEINAAIALESDRPDFYVRKAEVLVAKGDKAEAANTLRKICELAPTIFEARDACVIAARLTTPELGFEDPVYDEAMKDIAGGNANDAIARLSTLAESHSEGAVLSYQFGRAYEAKARESGDAADFEKAVDYYVKAATAAPEFADAFYGVASAQYALAGLASGDKANADKLVAMSEKMALKALELNPLHSDAALLLAKICRDRGEYEQALKYADCAYKVARDYDAVRPIFIDAIRLKSEAGPEAEFKAGECDVKVYPAAGGIGTITRRFDLYKDGALYKQFFEEVIADVNEGTGDAVTTYNLCEVLDKDNNTDDTVMPGNAEPTMDEFKAALENALNPQAPEDGGDTGE
jgi:tetratricopeptide (TPR) repeat protein